MRCFLGFHDWLGLGLFPVRDVFGNEVVVSMGRCRRCRKIEFRGLNEVSAGDDVEFAMRLEAAAKRMEEL